MRWSEGNYLFNNNRLVKVVISPLETRYFGVW